MDRLLLSTTQNATPITSEVVNIIPTQIYENVIQKCTTHSTLDSITGRIDKTTTFLLNPLTNELYLWKTDMKRYIDDIEYMNKDYNRVTLLGSDVKEKQIVVWNNDTCSIVYGASSGCIYYYNDITSNQVSTNIQLGLNTNEELVCITSLKEQASSIENILVAGTSSGRIFLIKLKLRPVVQLTCKCIVGSDSSGWLSYLSPGPTVSKKRSGTNSIIAMEDGISFISISDNLDLQVYNTQDDIVVVNVSLQDKICFKLVKDAQFTLLKTAHSNDCIVLSIRDDVGCIYIVSISYNWEVGTCTLLTPSSSFSNNPILFLTPDSQMVYSILQNPLVINAIHLPSTTIYKFDLPTAVVPCILNGCSGIPPYSDGMIFISSIGSVIHLRVKLPCLYKCGNFVDSVGVEDLLSDFESYVRDNTTLDNFSITQYLQLSSVALNNLIANTSTTILSKSTPDATPRDLLSEKQVDHDLFLKFLYYSGLYKLASTSRCTLRDHGELLTCAISAFDIISSSEFKSRDLFRNVTLSNPLQLPTILSNLITAYKNDVYFNDMTKLLLQVISTIQQFRQSTSYVYDIPLPSHDEYNPPWTYHEEIRVMLQTHIKHYTPFKPDGLLELSTFLLNSYQDKDEKSYSTSKEITISKIQMISGVDVAYQFSLDYLYFHGVVEIGTSHDQIDNQYSIKYLLSNPTSHDILKSVDYKTNLAFVPYLFTYCLETKQFSNLLDYGALSPQHFLEFSNKYKKELSSYSWVFHLRQHDYSKARSELVTLVSNRNDYSYQHQELLLSFTKVASKLHKLSRETTKDAFMISAMKREDAKIKNGFLLLTVQQILFPEVMDRILSIEELNQEVYHRLHPGTNFSLEKRVPAALSGLAISEANGTGYPYSQVYRACIIYDLFEWKELMKDYEVLSNENLKFRISNTLFYKAYHSYKDSIERFARNSGDGGVSAAANITLNMINKILEADEEYGLQDLVTIVSIAVRMVKEESSDAMEM